MPAIHPAKLRLQAAGLAELFPQPAAFARALHGLLGLYSDRTHRAGQSGAPPPLLSSYNVPPQMLRLVLAEVRSRAALDAPQTLALCQALWAEPFFELRLVAASLLGQSPVDPPEAVLAQLGAWVSTSPEERILAALLDQGLARLRQENPAALLALGGSWLGDKNLLRQQDALRMLRPLALEAGADHLPAIYTLITPLLRRVPTALRPDLLNLLAAAARRAPQETAYVLRQNLDAPENPDTAWIIRQVLDNFPPAQQDNLRAALRL